MDSVRCFKLADRLRLRFLCLTGCSGPDRTLKLQLAFPALIRRPGPHGLDSLESRPLRARTFNFIDFRHLTKARPSRLVIRRTLSASRASYVLNHAQSQYIGFRKPMLLPFSPLSLFSAALRASVARWISVSNCIIPARTSTNRAAIDPYLPRNYPRFDRRIITFGRKIGAKCLIFRRPGSPGAGREVRYAYPAPSPPSSVLRPPSAPPRPAPRASSPVPAPSGRNSRPGGRT